MENLETVGMHLGSKIQAKVPYSSIDVNVWSERVVRDGMDKSQVYDELFMELMTQYADKLRKFREVTGL